METQEAAPPSDELWAEYKRTGSRELRDKLIVRYSPLVKYVAGRVSVGLPHTIEQADLVSYGIFGLIDAIEKFDHQRAIKFETYAITRVKGAIIDELRSIDWVPRSIRAKARAIEKAYAKLEAENLRTPNDAEVATRARAHGGRAAGAVLPESRLWASWLWTRCCPAATAGSRPRWATLWPTAVKAPCRHSRSRR